MKDFKPINIELKSGEMIEIRALTEADLDKSLEFFRSFTEKERTYFRRDVTKKENVIKRIELMKSGQVYRIVATCNKKIIADGALELDPQEWKKHLGEIRIIISKNFQRKGLGMIIARELYFLASAAKLEKVVVKMMRAQKAARNIFRKLGFHQETVLQDYVRDKKGRAQDLLIMSINMKELWKEMENYFQLTDMRRHR